MNLLNALGGFPGAATFALMALGVMALPLKFPFYENSLLAVYCAFTFLLSANSAAHAFGREEVARALLAGTGDGDRPAVLARAWIPILVGTAGWALLLALSLASLRSVRPAAPLPPPLVLAGLLALNVGLASLITMLGAMIGIGVQSVKGTRDLLRMGFTFLLALTALGFFVMPDTWRVSLLRLLRQDLRFALLLVFSGAFLGLVSEFLLRRVLRLLAEKRQGLSILG